MTITKDNIRRILISKGRLLVKEKGADYLTARKLAEASAYSVGTIYNQFGTMDNFVLEQNKQTPALIPDMLHLWEEGAQDVYARRDIARESWLRRRLSRLYYRLLNRSTRFDVLENVGDFRLLDRRCILALRQLRESQRYTKGMYVWIGFKKQEISYHEQKRTAGQSSFNFRRLADLAIDGLTSYTTAPLRLSTLIGLLSALLAILYMVYVFIKTLVVGEAVQGFPTIVILILFLGGVQLISLGIIGEYLGKVFIETKRRPVYLIDRMEGVDHVLTKKEEENAQ